MRLFILYGNFVDDWNLFGVFSTLNQAKFYAKKIKEDYWKNSIVCNEVELDSPYRDHMSMINHYYYEPEKDAWVVSND